MKWSLSSHRMFRRCQRQYFFKHIAAHHAVKKDPLRREAFLLSQLKPLSTWQGLVIHEGIKEFVVPCLEQHHFINWDAVVQRTLEKAQRQFSFSHARRYRELGMTKKASNGDYCALLEHDRNKEIPETRFNEVCTVIQRCFTNLARMEDLWSYIQRRPFYGAEIPIFLQYEDATIQIVPDLLFSRGKGQFSIVDWKVEQDHTKGDHRFQTALYGWVLYHHEQWHVQDVEDLELIEVQLLQGQIERHVCSAEDFEELEDHIYRSLREIRALCGTHQYQTQMLSDYAFASSPNSCLYCSFNPLCKELAHGNLPHESLRDHEPLCLELPLSSFRGPGPCG